MQKVFFGQEKTASNIKDLSILESSILALAVFFLIYLGLYPSPVTKAVEPTVEQIITKTQSKELGKIFHLTIDNSNSPHGRH